VFFALLGLCCVTLLDDPLILGAGQAWYEQEKGMAQEIEGVLGYQSAGGRIGVPAHFHPFRVLRQDPATGKVIVHAVHAPGHETTLALNVGQRVRIQGKLVASADGQQELWVGKLTPLGAAPANAFTEVKPLARTNRFQPQMIRSNADGSTLVLRTAAEAAHALGQPPGIDGEQLATTLLANLLGVKTIDWKRQMVVYAGIVFNARTAVGTKKVEITRLDVNDRGLTVTWKVENTPVVRGSPFISETILIPRVEGEVTFKKEDVKGDGTPQPERLVPEKPVVPRPPVKK